MTEPAEKSGVTTTSWVEVSQFSSRTDASIQRTGLGQFALSFPHGVGVIVGQPAYENELYVVFAADYERELILARLWDSYDPNPNRLFVGKSMVDLKEVPGFHYYLTNRSGANFYLSSQEGQFAVAADGTTTKVGTLAKWGTYTSLSDDGMQVAILKQPEAIRVYDLSGQLQKEIPLKGFQEFELRHIQWTGTGDFLIWGDPFSDGSGIHLAHLWFISADGGERRELCKVCAFVQSPDGSSVAIAEEGSNLIRVNRFDGTEVAQLPVPGGDPIVKDLAWYRDQLVAVTGKGIDGPSRLWTLSEPLEQGKQ